MGHSHTPVILSHLTEHFFVTAVGFPQCVIGSQTFGQAVSSSVAMTAVGLATVLSAEVGQVVFSLALATLGTANYTRRNGLKHRERKGKNSRIT